LPISVVREANLSFSVIARMPATSVPVNPFCFKYVLLMVLTHTRNDDRRAEFENAVRNPLYMKV